MKSIKYATIIPAILSIAVFIVLVFSSAYAYFLAATNYNTVTNVSANLPLYTTMQTAATNCTLDFTSSEMTSENVNTSISDNCYLSVTINGSKTGYCTYDVVIEEIGEDTYVPSTGVGKSPNLFEFTGTVSGDATVNETQMNTLKTTSVVSNKLITIVNDGVPVTQTYNLTEKWYNLNLNQDIHSGKSYIFTFKVANVVC